MEVYTPSGETKFFQPGWTYEACIAEKNFLLISTPDGFSLRSLEQETTSPDKPYPDCDPLNLDDGTIVQAVPLQKEPEVTQSGLPPWDEAMY